MIFTWSVSSPSSCFAVGAGTNLIGGRPPKRYSSALSHILLVRLAGRAVLSFIVPFVLDNLLRVRTTGKMDQLLLQSKTMMNRATQVVAGSLWRIRCFGVRYRFYLTVSWTGLQILSSCLAWNALSCFLFVVCASLSELRRLTEMLDYIVGFSIESDLSTCALENVREDKGVLRSLTRM